MISHCIILFNACIRITLSKCFSKNDLPASSIEDHSSLNKQTRAFSLNLCKETTRSFLKIPQSNTWGTNRQFRRLYMYCLLRKYRKESRLVIVRSRSKKAAIPFSPVLIPMNFQEIEALYSSYSLQV